MASPEEKAIHQNLLDSAEGIGQRMSRTLPFKKGGWFVRLMEGFQDTARTVTGKDTGSEAVGEFTRRWLERETTKTEADSPIKLVEDTVNIDSDRESQNCQIGQNPHIIAIYYPGSGLRIPESLGLPQSEAAERLQDIGRFVTEISQAQREQELRQAVARRPAPAAV
jgi:hypothetical protein